LGFGLGGGKNCRSGSIEEDELLNFQEFW
jgi:hypothetical protein